MIKYFLQQHRARLEARKVLINDFNVSPELAAQISKMAQLEPVPKWLNWIRLQMIRISNFIHDGEFTLR